VGRLEEGGAQSSDGRDFASQDKGLEIRKSFGRPNVWNKGVLYENMDRSLTNEGEGVSLR